MKNRPVSLDPIALLSLLTIIFTLGCTANPGISPAPAKKYLWQVHDPQRPNPPKIAPGTPADQPPSDAIVLFDGRDLAEWTSAQGEPAKWQIKDGYMQMTPKAGDIRTKQAFGSCQLHIEWASPEKITGTGQETGNSGVFFMEKYEVQVLDSFSSSTYADGQAGALYGQKPPDVNVCRPPGQWQSYDIIFHAPVFQNNSLVKPATITVLHNSVLIQDHWVIEGTTFHKRRAQYQPHPSQVPLRLQDHGNPVRYRNIWIRPLPEQPPM
jgi:hypothetical protein